MVCICRVNVKYMINMSIQNKISKASVRAICKDELH